MKSTRPYLLALLTLTIILSACSTARRATNSSTTSISSLKFINDYIVPHNLSFQGTVVGGLSGIDYDSATGLYYMICDDPSAFSPARFYTARISIGAGGIDSVQFVDARTILDPTGAPYPDIRKDRTHSADLEAMRYDPTRKELIRSSEGQRISKGDSSQIQDPDIVIMDMEGHFKDSFELPSNMHLSLQEKGPRHNSVFEGVSYNDDYTRVYVTLEDAIYEDGPRAGIGDSTAWTRILEFDRTTRKQVAQYAYRIDAVPHPAEPVGAFKINGVTDILNAGKQRFIIIERGFSTGRVPSDIRVYLADMRKASNIAGTLSLQDHPPRRPVKKRLLVNMESIDRTIYNVEGVTFGPKLPNGHRSLVFVVDNNFSTKERTQFLLFEIIP